MLNKLLVLICTLMLLSGCGIMLTNSSLTEASRGKSFQELVEWQSTAESFEVNRLHYLLERPFYYIKSGQPMRSYINKAGNTVYVYFYWRSDDEPVKCDRSGCSGGYSECYMREQHYEFANDVVISAKHRSGLGVKRPLYSDACEGYDRIAGGDN
ncbi:MAG: hypothetical protein FWC38_07950 [Proteobacteria bacterium]|nr:hypothetical protein [Pseudomonadota bacterium]MCL2308133.1 hypothetical protein [Pseudomonadota bacterium]